MRDTKILYKMLVGKPEGKRPCGGKITLIWIFKKYLMLWAGSSGSG
jgi:hypothetical protein